MRDYGTIFPRCSYTAIKPTLMWKEIEKVDIEKFYQGKKLVFNILPKANIDNWAVISVGNFN